MNILITYSSGFGSTREIAFKIDDVLKENFGFNIETKSIDDINDLAPYDTVIVGSSVRADRPLANVRDFFARFRSVLDKKSFVLFAVCLTANCEQGRDKVKKDYLSQITEKYPEMEPVAIEAFGGKIDFDQLNPVMQGLMRRVLEKTGLPVNGSVDTRDWDFINTWTIELGKKLSVLEKGIPA